MPSPNGNSVRKQSVEEFDDQDDGSLPLFELAERRQVFTEVAVRQVVNGDSEFFSIIKDGHPLNSRMKS